MKLYVSSSWRNNYQPAVVQILREHDHEVYDFRHPTEGNHGFHWSSIDPNWKSWTPKQYLKALLHPLASEGFSLDYGAMQNAEGCVLVMPCGRSAHLEAGYFVGAGKPLWILVDTGEPELMYKMANGVFWGLGDLLLDIEGHEEGA